MTTPSTGDAMSDLATALTMFIAWGWGMAILSWMFPEILGRWLAEVTVAYRKAMREGK